MGETNENEPRRTRPGRVLAVCVAATLILGASAAIYLFTREPYEELDERVPWDPGDGPTRRLSGRVVTPELEPIAGAQVQLVYPGDPHWGETVAYETTSDDEGGFVFDGVARIGFLIVVRGEDGARTFDIPYEPYAAELRVGDVRLAPDHQVEVVVRCTSRPAQTRSSDTPEQAFPPTVELYWRPLDDLYARFYPATGEERDVTLYADSAVTPGRQYYTPRVPLDARRFSHSTRLPAGRFLAVVSGPCGVSQRVIEVQPETDAPETIELLVPPEDHGSLHIEAASREPTDAVYASLRQGSVQLAQMVAMPRQPAQVDVAPGRYVVTSGDECVREIEITSATTTHLRIGPGVCELVDEPE